MELRGIKGISKVFLRQEKVARFNAHGKYMKDEGQQEWLLDTEGVALLRVMCVEEVDHTQCNRSVKPLSSARVLASFAGTHLLDFVLLFRVA